MRLIKEGILGKVLSVLVELGEETLGSLLTLCERLAGERGAYELQQLKRYLRREPCWLPNVLSIDRSVKFDPVKFFGEGWSIWKGPKDGDGLTGEEEQDVRSLALTELDLTQVRLEHMLEGKETWIEGELKFERLKRVGYIRLDAQIFRTLWEDKSKIPESWKELVNGNTTFICFDGTILRDPDGLRYVLYLCWHGGRWDWDARWLVDGWFRHGPSAVLEKKKKKAA